MDIVPVANQRQEQQQTRDDQQSSRFRSVDHMAVVFRGRVVLACAVGHEAIVARSLRDPERLFVFVIPNRAKLGEEPASRS